jgi:hypothetical protein
MGKSGNTWDRLFLGLTLCAIAAFFVWRIAARQPPQPPKTQTAYSNPISKLPITNFMEIINASDRASLDGTLVHFTGLRVQKVDGAGSFWIGRFGDELLIVPPPQSRVREGDIVDVTGTVRAAYKLSPSWQAKNLGISDMDTLQLSGVYIDASHLRILGRRPAQAWTGAPAAPS